MYGAVLGDIIGSPFEFDRGDKTKAFELFTQGCDFTDDSVMTVAVAKALISAGLDADIDSIKELVIKEMQAWGNKYPYAGYGARFRYWLTDEKPKPYGSWGNGSAMRVSAAGWLYDSIERTREVARATAEVTHNHVEGIKGAEATASVIFMARNHAGKEQIREYIIKEFGYDLNRNLDDIRPFYHHVESCQETVPEAIIAFLEGNDFEDVIRNAISLGGDTDTLGAIAGSMAEAFYGIPKELIDECRERVGDEEMLAILDEIMPCEYVDYDPQELIQIAIDNQKNSYAPYSEFNVSAAVLMASGKVYTGVNIENASYPAGICAERNAIFSAINCGEKEIVAIAIVGGPSYTINDYCVPCGICRQVMREFSNPSNMSVIVAKTPNDYKEFTLDELLPESFGPEFLK